MTIATIEYATYIAADHADLYDDEPMTDEERDDALDEVHAAIVADFDAVRALTAYHATERETALPFIEEMVWESDLLDLNSDGEAA